MTKPDLSLSHGLDPFWGASLKVSHKALAAEKPEIPKGHIAASAPPQTIKSALLFFIIVKESPIAWVPVAHAVTGELFGPLRLYLIEIWPDSKLINEEGIKKGDIFLIPWLSNNEEFL